LYTATTLHSRTRGESSKSQSCSTPWHQSTCLHILWENTVLEAEFLQAQSDLVVFYNHPGQLTPGQLPHQTASISLLTHYNRLQILYIRPNRCVCVRQARTSNTLCRWRVSGRRARVRRGWRAHVRWCSAINQSANKTTQKARARCRLGRKWADHPRQTHVPMYFSRRGQCGARARPCRTASALAVQTCSGQIELAQNRDEKGGDMPGPVHALWCCAQGRGASACDARLVRAARGVQRAQQRAARAFFQILSPILFPIFSSVCEKGALA
jgi:hypothetical protein